jgi:hypothetical protein
VVSAGVSVKEKHGAKCPKVGLHLTYPGIPVNKSGNMLVRRKAVVALEEKFTNGKIPLPGGRGSVKLVESFSDVYDAAVARAPTQRMLGSSKLEFCKCKSKKEECPSTHFKGRYDAGRMERLFTILNKDGSDNVEDTNHYKQDVEACLKKLSLILNTQGKPPIAPDIDEEFESNRFAVEEGRKAAERKSEDADADAVDALEALREIYWPNRTFSAGAQYDKKSKTYVVRFTQKFCANKMCEHGNNGTYMVVNRRGMKVRCYSDGADGRIYGDCQQFEQSHPIPDGLYPELFGQARWRPPPAAPMISVPAREPMANRKVVETSVFIDSLMNKFRRHDDDMEF